MSSVMSVIDRIFVEPTTHNEDGTRIDQAPPDSKLYDPDHIARQGYLNKRLADGALGLRGLSARVSEQVEKDTAIIRSTIHTANHNPHRAEAALLQEFAVSNPEPANTETEE